MIRKWFGRITVLLLIILAVDARAQSSAQSAERSAEQSLEQSVEQPPVQSPEQSEAQSAEQSAEQSVEQSVEQSAEQSEAQSAEQSVEQLEAQSSEQPTAKAYRLTVTIHGSFGLCGNDEFGSQELYVVVKRLDLELQDQIDDTEREGSTNYRQNVLVACRAARGFLAETGLQQQERSSFRG